MYKKRKKKREFCFDTLNLNSAHPDWLLCTPADQLMSSGTVAHRALYIRRDCKRLEEAEREACECILISYICRTRPTDVGLVRAFRTRPM